MMLKFYLPGLFLAASVAHAQPVKQPAQQPAPIAFLVAEGVEIVSTFEGPGDLTGYVGRAGSQVLEIYLTPDGEHAIIGTLLDGKGNLFAKDHLEAAAPEGIAWEDLEKTHWIAEGDTTATKIVYAFTDPNCPYCATFWRAAQPYLKKGGVQLRHIMVGMLRPSSAGKAATILAAKDPAAALAKHEQTMQQGGLPERTDLPKKFVQQVEENTRFMRINHIGATPTIVFKDAQGKVRQTQGMPSNEVMATQIFGSK